MQSVFGFSGRSPYETSSTSLPNTGVSDPELSTGVHFHAGGAITQSSVMRSHAGTVRTIEPRHQLDKPSQISSVDYA